MKPPDWDALARLLPKKQDVIFAGTGGWIHAVPGDFTKLHSLDPRALASLPDDAAVIGMSQSRTTLETSLLMETLAERYDDCSWLPLPADVSPLFSAPSSNAFLLPLAISRGLDGARETWARFLALRGGVPAIPDEATYITHPACEPWLRQLCRQGLSATTEVRFALAIDTGDPVVDAMLAMDAAGRAVAGHRDFVRHRPEPLYKSRVRPDAVVLGEPLDVSDVPEDAVVYCHRPPRGIEGSDWNHHSYDHALRLGQAVTIIDPLGIPDPVPGFSMRTLERNTRVLKAIARATRDTLPT